MVTCNRPGCDMPMPHDHFLSPSAERTAQQMREAWATLAAAEQSDITCDQCGQVSRRLAATVDLVDALRAVIQLVGDPNTVAAAKNRSLLIDGESK